MSTQKGTAHPDWPRAMWALYWHVFHGVSRKETLRDMIACGLTTRQAIEEMQTWENSREDRILL